MNVTVNVSEKQAWSAAAACGVCATGGLNISSFFSEVLSFYISILDNIYLMTAVCFSGKHMFHSS